MPSLVESGQVVLKKIFESFQCICTKRLSSSSEKGMVLNLNKFKSSFIPNTLCFTID